MPNTRNQLESPSVNDRNQRTRKPVIGCQIADAAAADAAAAAVVVHRRPPWGGALSIYYKSCWTQLIEPTRDGQWPFELGHASKLVG